MAEECLANLPAYRSIALPIPPRLRCTNCCPLDRVSCQNDLAGDEGSQGESGDPRCPGLGARS